MRVESIPVSYRGLYLKSLAAECSPRQAIKAKCQECVGYELASESIRECSDRQCPLWKFRPYQEKDLAEDRSA